MSIIIFLLILSALVFVHELGHFLVAKKNGIRVDEFAIGFPPKLFSIKKGETTYAINLLPLGGYVKIFGENPDDESINGPDKERSFVNKSKLAQASVLVAGIVFNILFAFVLFSASFMVGVSGLGEQTDGSKLVVAGVLKDSAASIGGLQEGDIITKLAGKTELVDINAETVREFVNQSNGESIQVTVLRGSETKLLEITPQKDVEQNVYLVGIQMMELSEVKLPIHKAIVEGAKMTVLVVKETTVGIVHFLWNIVTFNANFKDVAGPVGIAGLVGEASKFGLGYLFSFAALISINLAVINLIPFPALDGGRLLFVAIEAITRKPLNPKIANTLNLVGFALLLVLMLAVTFSDIKKLF